MVKSRPTAVAASKDTNGTIARCENIIRQIASRAPGYKFANNDESRGELVVLIQAICGRYTPLLNAFMTVASIDVLHTRLHPNLQAVHQW